VPLSADYARVLEARRRALNVAPQFLKFAVVGTVGFLADASTVYGLRHVIGIYAAGFAATAVATSVTWLFNRLWTFQGFGGGPIHRQIMLYIAANMVGLLLNRTTFVLLVVFTPVCARYPILAVAAGAVAGMFINFSLSRSMVFRASA
jgi:putative flippase GtrA